MGPGQLHSYALREHFEHVNSCLIQFIFRVVRLQMVLKKKKLFIRDKVKQNSSSPS